MSISRDQARSDERTRLWFGRFEELVRDLCCTRAICTVRSDRELALTLTLDILTAYFASFSTCSIRRGPYPGSRDEVIYLAKRRAGLENVTYRARHPTSPSSPNSPMCTIDESKRSGTVEVGRRRRDGASVQTRHRRTVDRSIGTLGLMHACINYQYIFSVAVNVRITYLALLKYYTKRTLVSTRRLLIYSIAIDVL